MQITAADEYPFHQHPTPFNIPYTSDVHFNDGYFCAAFAEDWYVVAGLRLHPNMNVIDGFAGLARRGEQRVLRVSRVLRPHSNELTVGPLSIEIHQPLQAVSLRLEEAGAGFTFDLHFTARAAPFLETPYRFRRYGQLIHDMLRYTQICRVSGTVTRDDETVTATDWTSLRDHSWGVRAGMGPKVASGGVARDEDEIDHRHFRLWAPFATDAYTGFFNTHEARDGTTLDFEGCLDFPDGRRVRLTAIRHALEHAPGTHNVVGGSFALMDGSGHWREYRLRAAGTPADVQGLGYYGGWQDGGSAGVWRGAGPVVEVDRYPQGAALGRAGLTRLPAGKRLGPTEFPCWLEGPDGERGMVHLEHHLFGMSQT